MNHSELQNLFLVNLQMAERNTLPLADLFSLAELLQSSKMVDSALKLYEIWTQKTTDPNKPLALFNYGSLLQTAGKQKEAENIYRLCLAERPFFEIGRAHV